MRKLLFNLAGAVAIGGLGANCLAAQIAYEGFNGGLYQETAIANSYVVDGEVPNPVFGIDFWGGNAAINQPGSAGPGDPNPNSNRRTGQGWADLSFPYSADSNPVNVQAGWRKEQGGSAILYQNSLTAPGALPSTAGRLDTTGSNEIGRRLPATMGGSAQSTYLSFIYNRSGDKSNQWGGLGLFLGGNPANPQATDADYQSYTAAGGARTEKMLLGQAFSANSFGVVAPSGTSDSGVELNQLNYVVMSLTPGANVGETLVNVYLNEAPGLIGAPEVSFTTASDLSFNAVVMRGGGGNWSFDEIRIGESLSDVHAIPEPHTLGLLAVGALSLLRRRSR